MKSVLLHGGETWKDTKKSTDKLQIFINKCSLKILPIFWLNSIRNDLLHLTGQDQGETEIKNRKRGWHILRKPSNCIANRTLDWNPQGKRKRDRPDEIWRRSTTDELRKAATT